MVFPEMKFTPAQREILARLDGSFERVEFSGVSRKPIENLAKAGLVTYRRETYTVRTGTFPYARQGVRYVVALTKDGHNFIYDGGIDA